MEKLIIVATGLDLRATSVIIELLQSKEIDFQLVGLEEISERNKPVVTGVRKVRPDTLVLLSDYGCAPFMERNVHSFLDRYDKEYLEEQILVPKVAKMSISPPIQTFYDKQQNQYRMRQNRRK